MICELMGVVNVTPDSFSDGGAHLDPEDAIAHGRALKADGADWLDVGGESTRPGAEPVGADEELRRVLPVVEGLVADGARVSVDTSKLQVAERSVAAGATMVNDVTALRADPGIAELVASSDGVSLCLMHMLGDPRTMQDDPRYDDVVDDVCAFLAGRAAVAVTAGVPEERIVVDPGIGFGKTLAHNVELLARLPDLTQLGFRVLVGVSRKSFLGKLTGRERPADRLAASLAAGVLAHERGASILRVHDVAPHRDALIVAGAVLGA